jgi:alpha-D-xyloside xylohydrolase
MFKRQEKQYKDLIVVFKCFIILIFSVYIIACDDERTSTTELSELQAGVMAGEQAGVMAGEQAGVMAGEQAGVMAGEQAGTMNYMREPWIWQVQDDVILTVERQPFQMTLTYNQEEIVTFTQQDLGFGTVDQVRDDLSYDPYWLHHEFLGSLTPPPVGLTWVSITALIEVNSSINMDTNQPNHLLTVLLSDGSQAQLKLQTSSEHSLIIHLQKESVDQVAYAFWQAPIREQENFYGLGESFDTVARRGTYRAMNFQPLLETESAYNEAHVPVPLLISTHNIAYFYETYLPSYFDIEYTIPNILRAEQAHNTEGLKLHLIWHEHPFEAINTYYELTTRPLIPPYWSFAPHYWRNVTTGQSEVEADLQQMRDLSIPGGVFWIDRPYQNTYNDCRFDPTKYSDPTQMMKLYKDLGYRMLLWHAPYTSEASDAWEEASSGEYFLDGPQFFTDFGRVMDFTNPDAVNLWQRLLQRFNTFNVAGYKLDYGEDVQVGVNNRRLRFNFHDGSNELTMHHKYASYYHQTYLDTLPSIPPRPDGDQAHLVDGFILARSSTFNGQNRLHALWPGDLDSDFTRHLEDDYWVGGLPAAVIAGLTLAASGFPIFAADTGGFRNGRPTQEVLIRWAWQTAFSAIMQIGGGGSSHFPWASAGSNEAEYDADGIHWMREAARWHIRLADYRFTWALHARRTGVPLMQPWGMAFPTDGRHPSDAYLLGPDLLIAPIIDNQDTRSIPIPHGKWLDLWTQESFTGPGEDTQQIPLGSQAIMIRQGAIIPLLDADIVTLNPVSEQAQTQGVRSRINQPGTLTWLIVPGIDQFYQNHDGHQVELQSQSIHISPAEMPVVIDHEGIDDMQLQRAKVLYELPVYPQFALDLRFDATQMTPERFLVDEVILMEVDQELTWQNCDQCVWRSAPGRIQIKLLAHQGQNQVVTW